jgi:hypothetical protein
VRVVPGIEPAVIRKAIAASLQGAQ